MRGRRVVRLVEGARPAAGERDVWINSCYLSRGGGEVCPRATGYVTMTEKNYFQVAELFGGGWSDDRHCSWGIEWFESRFVGEWLLWGTEKRPPWSRRNGSGRTSIQDCNDFVAPMGECWRKCVVCTWREAWNETKGLRHLYLDTAIVGGSVIHRMAGALAIEDKADQLRDADHLAGTNRGKLGHCQAISATSSGLIRMSSTGSGSPCA
jgi:hypothetical protein